jgi:hypothetical protein
VYRDERVLLDAVTLFAAQGLGRNEGVILVATAPHLRALDVRLEAADVPVYGLRTSGQLVTVPADDLLATFMRDGLPNAALFEAAVMAMIHKLRSAGHAHVRVFGEMVDLLWKSRLPATLRLEELWNEIVEAEQISLLCSYSHDRAGIGAPARFPSRLSALHTHVIPPEESGTVYEPTSASD